jgi:hypothetical protein
MVPDGLFARFLRILVPSVTQKYPKIVQLVFYFLVLAEKGGTPLLPFRQEKVNPRTQKAGRGFSQNSWTTNESGARI